mmetsp:Transcript_78858/g.218140  ORF Transcript_78858/g.218140 Transcript_78858/m.218140 type:complete len:209 (+) Transcript_78858:464-1090(+)
MAPPRAAMSTSTCWVLSPFFRFNFPMRMPFPPPSSNSSRVSSSSFLIRSFSSCFFCSAKRLLTSFPCCAPSSALSMPNPSPSCAGASNRSSSSSSLAPSEMITGAWTFEVSPVCSLLVVTLDVTFGGLRPAVRGRSGRACCARASRSSSPGRPSPCCAASIAASRAAASSCPPRLWSAAAGLVGCAAEPGAEGMSARCSAWAASAAAR